MNNCFDKGLYSKLEVPSSQQNVLPDMFMGTGVFLKELINCYSVNSAFFMASNIDIGDVVVSQKSSEIFGVPSKFTFVMLCLQYITFLPSIST